MPHNDLVTSLMKRRFTVNLLGEPIEIVSTTESSILPSFHHTTVGFGLPKINNNTIRATVQELGSLEKSTSVYPQTPDRSSRDCNLPRRVQPLLSPLAPEHRISQVWMVLLERGEKRELVTPVTIERQTFYPLDDTHRRA